MASDGGPPGRGRLRLFAAETPAVAAAATDPLSVRTVRALLDGLGSYASLAAEVLLLQHQDASPAGRPAPAALTQYRSATDLLRLTLLPAARQFVDRQDQTVAAEYGAERARARAVRLGTIVVGVVLQVGWGGYLGSEFRNITFAGERAAAERVLDRYQIYQADDREIRRPASTGQQRAAIALCTSYAPGGSNYAFDQYDSALSTLIDINQQAFRTAVHDDERHLMLWQFVPGSGALGVLVLLFLGLRPRLAEYR